MTAAATRHVMPFRELDDIVPEALRDHVGWDELHDAAATRIVAEFGLLLPRDRELIRQLAFVRATQGQILPFGKYLGWLVSDVLDRDPKYLKWLASQPDFPEKRSHLYQIIIEGLGPDDAPKPEAAISLVKHTIGCCTCGGPAHFGYHEKSSDVRWYCAGHRPAQCWADEIPPPF
jgi:uncharacterized protein (DUF3820 family)